MRMTAIADPSIEIDGGRRDQQAGIANTSSVVLESSQLLNQTHVA